MYLKIRFTLFAGLFALCSFGQDASVSELIDEGIYYHDEGDYQEAVNFFRRALELDPGSSAANYELANSYYSLGDYQHAEEYSRKVLAMADANQTVAAMVLGSSLDSQGRAAEAIEVYEAAMAREEHYLLYYNHALTCYNLQAYDKAYDSLIKAIGLNISHAGSHRVLSLVMQQRGATLQAMLPLYFFLLIEPESDRSYTAYDTLWNLLYGNLLQDAQSAGQATVQVGGDPDFETAGRLIRMMRNNEDQAVYEAKSAVEKFTADNERIFKVLGEMRPGKSGIWWDAYVDFLAALARNGHTGAFSYFISQSSRSGWQLSEDLFIYGSAVDAMGAWMQTYQPGSGE